LGSKGTDRGVHLWKPGGAVPDCAGGTNGKKDGRGIVRFARPARIRPEGGKSEDPGGKSAIRREFGRPGGEAEGAKRGGHDLGICAQQARHPGDFRASTASRLAQVFVFIGGAPIFEGITAGGCAHRHAGIGRCVGHKAGVNPHLVLL